MTVEQRRQALDFGKIRGTGMPVPSGMIGTSSRAHILNLYYEVYVPAPFFSWRNRNLISGLWSSKATPSSSWASKSSPAGSWAGKIVPPDSSVQEI